MSQTKKIDSPNTNTKPVVSKRDLEAMIAKLQDENQRLKAITSSRPSDALCVTSCKLVFQKGTHKDLVGKQVKFLVPLADGTNGFLHSSGVVKLSSNGNAYCILRGWLDPSSLTMQVVEVSDEAKAAASFKDVVVGS